jgi:hypothetical protein
VPKIVDLTGRKIARLTVIANAGKDHRRRTMYLCLCECGMKKKVRGDAIGRSTFSCGCLLREAAANRTRTHGMTGTPEHSAYLNAIYRCTRKSHARYSDYEFRFTDFAQFFKELGPRPHGTSLDRKDTNGHYEPGNVRWATIFEQNRNRRPMRKRRSGGKQNNHRRASRARS